MSEVSPESSSLDSPPPPPHPAATGAAETEADSAQAAAPRRHARKPPAQGRLLRIWPAAVLLLLLWCLRILPGFVHDMSMAVVMIRFMGPLVCSGLIFLWWLLFSRSTKLERLGGAAGLIAILIVTTMLADKSLQGFGVVIFTLPWGLSGFAVGMIAAHMIRSITLTRWRTGVGLAVALLCCGFWDLVRTDEIYGDFRTRRSWRWEPTDEDRFLETLASRQPGASIAGPLGEPEWPEFRGPQRDGKQPGVRLVEDWKATPPREIWRIRLGPGWSSFAVAGKRLFTQEQRGENEVVVCYGADGGEEIWVRSYESRFWEVVGGAGPRATPTLHDGKLYALGANGILHCLNPLNGHVLWRADINADAGREPPTWGYSSSPLVTGGRVIVHAGGAGEKGVLAYDAADGKLSWSAAAGDHSYSSPQRSKLAGRDCILMLTNNELLVLDPDTGKKLGAHEWKFNGYRVVQPLVVGASSVLMGTAMGSGTRRIELRPQGEGFHSEETWKSRVSPYYNDYVAHKGHLYGFDNNIFCCVDLADGKRKWKRGRYGNGQVLLLPDADQLLVISEEGELVLLRATPQQHQELARYQVLEGRTWNHPVVVGNRLYVRNGKEAVCLEIQHAKP